MSFARLWTAALAGAAAALPMSLCFAAMASLFAAAPGFGRNGLSPTFLVSWAIVTLLCVCPRNQLRQWLIAVWTTIAMFGLTALLLAIFAGAMAASAILALLCLLIGWLAVTLAPKTTGDNRR